MTGNDLVADTNAYSDWQRGVRWLDEFAAAERVWIPFVVVAELLSGFAVGSRAKTNEAAFKKFLAADSVKVLFADAGTASVYADIYASLKKGGTPIPTNDIWIAALCVQLHLPLASADKHFDHVPLLKRA